MPIFSAANQGGLHLSFKGVVNVCWVWFKWGLVLGVIGVVLGVFYFRGRMNEEIRRRVVALISEHYTGLKVTARSAGLVEGGIEVRGLSIVEPGAEGAHAELAYLDEVKISCGTDWRELLGGRPQVSQITIRRPTLQVTRRPDGTWSAARLLPPPKLSTHPPKVVIENGTIEVFDPLKSPSGTLTLREVNLTLTPRQVAGGGGETAYVRDVQGTLSANHLRQVELEGQYDERTGTWTIGGTVEGLDISPELRDALPGPWAAKLAVLGELRGQGRLSFRVGYDPAAESPYRFDITGRLARGEIDDPRLPHALTDMRAAVRFSNAGFTIDDLVARSGETELRLSARGAGFDAAAPLSLEGEVRQLELDRELIDRLPKELQDQWDKYLPAGRVDAVVKLKYEGGRWYPDVSVRCLNVSFTNDKFPYRLEQGKGYLTLKDDLLQVHLLAYSGSQEVRVDAEVLHPTSGPCGWFEAKGQGLPLDEKLLGAMHRKPQTREFVRSLRPRGTVDIYVRTERQGPEQPLRKRLLVGLNRCGIQYEKFSYPVSNIRGTIEMCDDYWTFRGLEGNNDTGQVTCEGYMTSPEQGHELYLHFTGTDVPLEEELRDALKPSVRRVWNALRPRGRVDLVAEVRYKCAEQTLSLGVRAEPRGESTSIEPVGFPFRMEKVRGVLVYRDGRATLERFRAEHGAVKLAAGGHCELLPDGRWSLCLEKLSVDRLRLEDRDLIVALPERLKRAILELKPIGPISLSGTFALEGGAQASDPLRSRWDLVVGLHGGSVDCGIKLENLYGSMRLSGGFDGQRSQCSGELAIDSLTFKELQFTEVMGPLWIDEQQALFGSWVARRQGGNAAGGRQQPRPLTAKLFGGTVYSDAWVARGPLPRYGLQATLSQAELSIFAQEVMAGRQDLRGKLTASIDLGGVGRSLNGMAGHGNVRLRDADIYELPLMVALLKIVSIREPDRTAFSKSDIDFDVQGNHIYFKRIDFNGDAISLLGQGEMDLQSNVALNFHALVGRDEIRVPILRGLMREASEQIVQIRVGGTLQNPQMEKEAFPVVTQALQELQNEIQRGTGSAGRLAP